MLWAQCAHQGLKTSHPLIAPHRLSLHLLLVGRLAAAAAAQLYPKAGLAVSGPTISGCTLGTDGTSISVEFNVTLLGAKGDKVQVGTSMS